MLGDNVTTASFTQECGFLPLKMYTDNFPSRAARSIDDPLSSVCDGIPNAIVTDKYVDALLLQQCVIYVLLIIFSIFLSREELVEKRHTRISLYLDGVFHPRGLNGDNWIRVLKSIVAECIVFVLPIWYFVTNIILTDSTIYWYIFPTRSQEIVAYDREADIFHAGWCNLLQYPVKIAYIKSNSKLWSSALLQTFIFFQTCAGIHKAQKKIYDWIDTEIYMDEDVASVDQDGRMRCCYYNLHTHRSRNFNEDMLNDWKFANLYLHVFKEILENPEVRKKIKSEGEIADIKKYLGSIEQKLPLLITKDIFKTTISIPSLTGADEQSSLALTQGNDKNGAYINVVI